MPFVQADSPSWVGLSVVGSLRALVRAGTGSDGSPYVGPCFPAKPGSWDVFSKYRCVRD